MQKTIKDIESYEAVTVIRNNDGWTIRTLVLKDGKIINTINKTIHTDRDGAITWAKYLLPELQFKDERK